MKYPRFPASAYPAMRFTKHADGRVTVDRFRPALLISGELLRAPHHPGFVRSFRTIRFYMSNGRATYRIVGYQPEHDVFSAARIA